jgi:hypothetical protein
MDLSGKTIACFIALPHHSRFLLPVINELRKRGARVVFLVSDGDYPFELDLRERNEEFFFLRQFLRADHRKRIADTERLFLDDWAQVSTSWLGFRHWPLFKQSWIISSVIEEYHAFDAFMEERRPDVFLALHERNRWGKIIGHLAMKRNIPYVTFQEGDYHEPRLSMSSHTEYSTVDLLWGQDTYAMLAKAGCAGSKMVLIGNTHLDSAIVTYSAPERTAAIRQDLGIHPGRKTLVVIMDLEWASVSEPEFWKKTFRGVPRQVNLIIKWHPNIKIQSFEQVKALFSEIAPDAILVYTYDSYALLAVADCCVMFGKSTLALEALAFRKPVVSVPTLSGGVNLYADKGVALPLVPAESWAVVHEVLDTGLTPQMEERIGAYLADAFYHLDGNAALRAADVIAFVAGTAVRAPGIAQPPVQPECVKGRVSFILPSGSDPGALMASLTSIAHNVRYDDWQVVVVITSESVRECLMSVAGDVVLVDAAGERLGAYYNEGAGRSSGEFLFFLAPGILVERCELPLTTLARSIVGSTIHHADGSPWCLGYHFDFNGVPVRSVSEPSAPPPSAIVGGGFLCLSRDAYSACKGFDEEIADAFVEADLCLTAVAQGYSIDLSPAVVCRKYGDIPETAPERNGFYDGDWRGRVRFFAKWAGRIDKSDDFLAHAKKLSV